MPRSRQEGKSFTLHMVIEGEYLDDVQTIQRVKAIKTGADIMRFALRDTANRCREEESDRQKRLNNNDG